MSITHRFQCKNEILVEIHQFVIFNLYDHLESLRIFAQSFKTNCPCPWAIRRCKNIADKNYVLLNSESAQCSFFIFDKWHSSSSKSAAVYKILSKSYDYSPRYGDITIFKMATVRHLGIVLPPYETTHEVSVAGRSCLSNFMSIWYTDLKI